MVTTLEVDGLTTRLGELGLGPPPKFSEAHVLVNLLDIGRSYLADILSNILECEPGVAYDSIHWPNDIYTGDFTVPLKKLNKDADPKELAIKIADKFPSSPLFGRPFREGNAAQLRILFTSRTFIHLLLYYIHDRKHLYGQDLSIGAINCSSSDHKPRTVVVEFSSPNIGSEFHEKHLRSTILGSFIANLYENMGWDVVRLNYLGDWGKNLGLLGAGWAKFGSEEDFRRDPVRHLLKVYNQMDELFQPELAESRTARDKGDDTASIESRGVFAERNDFFRRMEDSDDQTLELWKRFRSESINYYDKQYSALNIKFDDYSGESQIGTDTMDEVEDMLRSKGISEEGEGAWIVDFSKHKDGPSKSLSGRAIIRDRNGSRTYQLRELAAVLERSRKYSFDKMVYVVANDHDLHFSRTIKILELLKMEDLANKLQHVHFHKGPHGPETTGGNNLLSDIIDKCTGAMQTRLTAHADRSLILGESIESAKNVGISVLLAQVLSVKRSSEHSVDIEKMVNSGRMSGLELQYWYTRLSHLLPSLQVKSIELSDEQIDSVGQSEYFNLLRILAEYPDVTALARKSLESQVVTSYLTTITDQLDICFEDEAEEEEESSSLDTAKIAVWEATRQVLDNGMRLLGIRPVHESLRDG